MKIVKLLFWVGFLVLVAGFTYFAVTDVSVPQSEVVKTIPNDRFF